MNESKSMQRREIRRYLRKQDTDVMSLNGFEDDAKLMKTIGEVIWDPCL